MVSFVCDPNVSFWIFYSPTRAAAATTELLCYMLGLMCAHCARFSNVLFAVHIDDLGQFGAQFRLVDVSKDQIHRAACCFFFAVSMIDQNFVQVFIYLFQPSLVCVTG